MHKKVAVFHDHFMYRGGGEKLITLLAKAADADIVTGYFDESVKSLVEELDFKGKIIEVKKPFFKFIHKRSYSSSYSGNRSGFLFFLFKILWQISLRLGMKYNAEVLKDYDMVIFSGDSLIGVDNVKDGARLFYYCHTPPRFIYDQKNEYLAKVPFLLKPFYLFFLKIGDRLYKKSISKIEKIFTNSKTTQERINEFLGLDSIIIYPPVDISFFKPSDIRGDYYFSWARLAKIKRIDRIVEAFIKMPQKKLLISYQDSHPEKEKIFNMIKGYRNITTIKSPTDKELQKLISESVATIFIPVKEDFGMTPVESLACGVPVIGVNDGGVKEIILDGKTGVLIDEDAKVEDLIDAVNKIDLEVSIKMKIDCLERAKLFSLESFNKGVKNGIL